MAIMAEREPRAFQSDKAVWFQTARRFRALTDRDAGTYWNNGQQRTVRVYREMRPKDAAQLGRMLMQSLGTIGVRIRRLDVAEGERVAAAKSAVSAALSAADQLDCPGHVFRSSDGRIGDRAPLRTTN